MRLVTDINYKLRMWTIYTDKQNEKPDGLYRNSLLPDQQTHPNYTKRSAGLNNSKSGNTEPCLNRITDKIKKKKPGTILQN